MARRFNIDGPEPEEKRNTKKGANNPGDKIRSCPYCQRPGVIFRIVGDEMIVTHKVERQRLTTPSGGEIECEVLLDSCWMGIEVIRNGVRSQMIKVETEEFEG